MFREVNASTVYIVVTIMFILSYWIHLPAPFGPVNYYSDIIYLYHVVFSEGRRWFTHPNTYGLPYVDYFLEYPIIVGLCFAVASLPRLFLNEPLALLVFYHIMTLILYVATIICIRECILISMRAGLAVHRILLFIPCTLSFIMYVVYNWDIIASAFMMMSIRLFLERRYVRSALCLSLAISSKLIPGVLILPVVLYLSRVRDIIEYVMMVLATYFILNLPIMIVNFEGWIKFWNYHLSWYVEGSWLILIFEYYDSIARLISKILFVIIMVILMVYIDKVVIRCKCSDVTSFIEVMFLFIAGTLFSSYIFTPQMSLLLYPLIAITPSIPLTLLYTFDIPNAAIMMFWFTYNEWLKEIFGFETPVFTRTSPIALLIVLKCFTLLVMMIIVIRQRMIKLKLDSINESRL